MTRWCCTSFWVGEGVGFPTWCRIGPGFLLLATLVACGGNTMTVRSSNRPTSCAGAAVIDTATYLVNEVDEPPSYRQGLVPRMPAKFVDTDKSGRVGLQFSINADGRIDRTSVEVYSATDTGFVAAARTALLSSLYWPACLHDHPVRVRSIRQAVAFIRGLRD